MFIMFHVYLFPFFLIFFYNKFRHFKKYRYFTFHFILLRKTLSPITLCFRILMLIHLMLRVYYICICITWLHIFANKNLFIDYCICFWSLFVSLSLLHWAIVYGKCALLPMFVCLKVSYMFCLVHYWLFCGTLQRLAG